MNLLQGEKLIFTTTDDEQSAPKSDDAINEKYVKGEVRIVTEQARYPLDSIRNMVESDKYELNPEFQRRHRWDAKKQSRLIESFIMNVPIPPIFLYEDRFSHYEVMDGLQRLTAIHDFYIDKLRLEGLEIWSELNGRTYSQLPEQVRNGVDRRYLSSIILLQETAKDPDEARRLKQLVFERINSGGVKLEPQESRNAIYNGPLNQLCIRLARNPYLCRTWDIPEPTAEELAGGSISSERLRNENYRRMNDVELVLRFFAFRQRLQNPKGSLEKYLDTFLKYGNDLPSEVLDKLEILFNQTIELVYNTLGERAFRLWRPRKSPNEDIQTWGWYDQPAMTAYDPIMHVFSQYLEDADEIVRRKKLFQERIKRFYADNYVSFGGRSTTNISNITQRNELFEGFLREILSSKL
jgi:hypothetical protein